MKRIFYLLLAAACLAVSCKTTDELTEKGTLAVTPSVLEFGRVADSELVSLTTDAGSWTLTENADWCTPEKTSGRASSTFRVSVDENTGSERSVVIEFTADGCDPVTLTVIQKGTEKPLPAGAKHGINYNADGSVTFVLYEKDKTGKKYYDFCYIVGEFNDWEVLPKYSMERDETAGCWWITLDGFDASKEYAFQYRLKKEGTEDVYVSDPYTEIVYDMWNDQYISPSVYPNLKKLPSNKAQALVSAFQINRPEYEWQVTDFKVEDKNDLVIYELLIRDFSATSDLRGVLAQMDYLENLGINAIELMPVQEFDGNRSWGYNPNHYFALDKAYGTREMYKQFIDECHKRGIAVFLDVVYNHMTGIATLAKLYYNGGATTANNPWFNVSAPHPWSVFHDFNHEEPMVREHIKRSLTYLLEEYKIDGFRFDLTKGFTQKQSNESTAGNYDQSRVDILKDYNSHIMSVNPDAVVILEHFADSENIELGKAGMKVWRNGNNSYRNALHGSASDFTYMCNAYNAQGVLTDNVPFGTYVGFMESHDEQRLCFEAVKDDAGTSVSWGITGTLTGWSAPDITMEADGLFYVAHNVEFTAADMFKIRGNEEWNDDYNYGASTKGYKLPLNQGYSLTLGSSSQDMAVPAAGTYDIYFNPDVKMVWLMTPGQRPADPEVENEDPFEVAMRRAGLNAAFFLTTPGPKMIWQFGEIGYDISGGNGDTSDKPVLTDEYMADEHRKGLYDTYAALLQFRKENPRFFDSDAKFRWYVGGSHWPGRYIFCEADGKTFAVVGNFGNSTQNITVELPSAGTWYNYFDSDETLNGAKHDIRLKQGEYKLFVNWN